MTKRLLFIIVLISFVGQALAQETMGGGDASFAKIDELMAAKPDSIKSLGSLAQFINTSFTNDYQKTRAIFYWVTRNIAYSPELMYTFTTNPKKPQLVKEAFENKVAICTGYSSLFDTLCQLTDVTSFVVSGCTQQSFLPSVIGHAWVAVKIAGEWCLVDPTWGSGYINGKEFVKSPNEFYFLSKPAELIKTHLPFDPIWQLLNRPVNLYQFHNHLKSTAYDDWNYTDSIAAYLGSNEMMKIKGTSRRLTGSGVNSETTFNYLNNLKAKEYEVYNAMLLAASKEQNNAVDRFNDYINFKNHQFTPPRTDAAIKKILPDILQSLENVEKTYTLVTGQLNNPSDANFVESINRNLTQLTSIKKRVSEEQKFVNKYLLTAKNKRRDLFYTRIVSGRP